MANKLTPIETQFYLSEIRSSEARQKSQLITRWQYPTLVGYYEGELLIDPDRRDEGVARRKLLAIINKHFPKTNILISDILFNNPDIIADPTQPFAIIGNKEFNVEENAPLMRGALIHAYDKTGAQEENRIALFDMLFAGYAGVEVDHIKTKRDTQIGINKVPTEEQIEERRTGIMGKVKEGFKKLTGKPTNQQQAEDKAATEAADEKEAFADTTKTYIRRWDPLNILFDWQAKRFKDSRYLIKKRIMSKSKFDAEFPKFKDKVQAGKFLEFGQHHSGSEKQSVIVYEVQVRKANNVYTTIVLTPTLMDAELDMFDRPYTTNGFNIKIGTLNKYGVIYPVPVAKINKTISDEWNEYIYNWKNVAERNVPKFLVNTKKVNSGGIDALRSKHTNDIVDVDGQTDGAVTPLQPTKLSNDNKELVGLYASESEKTWGVSDAKSSGSNKNIKFAEQLKQQEAGFQSVTSDSQEGLRQLMQEELETVKDIIVTFWDEEIFIKITGGPKPQWYVPMTLGGVVVNPLSDLLTADYFIKVDVTQAFRPNKDKDKNDSILLLREIISEEMTAVLARPSEKFPNGRQLSTQFLDKVVKKFGEDPEIVFEPIQTPQVPAEGEAGLPSPEQILAGGGA